MAHVESTSQISLRSATFGQRSQGLPLLVLRQLRRSAHVDTASASLLPSIPGAGANKFALKFREAAQYGQHQPPVRRGCVRPCVSQRAKSSSSLCYRVDYVEEIARRPGESVKSGHEQGVANDARGHEKER